MRCLSANHEMSSHTHTQIQESWDLKDNFSDMKQVSVAIYELFLNQ